MMASKSFEIDEVFYFLVKIELSLHCNSRSYVNSALVIKIYLTKKCVDSNCKLDLCLRLFYKTCKVAMYKNYIGYPIISSLINFFYIHIVFANY